MCGATVDPWDDQWIVGDTFYRQMLMRDGTGQSRGFLIFNFYFPVVCLLEWIAESLAEWAISHKIKDSPRERAERAIDWGRPVGICVEIATRYCVGRKSANRSGEIEERCKRKGAR
jgi:hypothetical protein